MLLTIFALSVAAAPAMIEKSPDDIVCKTKYDRRTKLRTGKVCKTRAEWEGKYEEEDAQLAASASSKPSVEPASSGPVPAPR